MEERVQDVTAELSKTAAAARAQFGHLSPDQLNWNPDVHR